MGNGSTDERVIKPADVLKGVFAGYTSAPGVMPSIASTAIKKVMLPSKPMHSASMTRLVAPAKIQAPAPMARGSPSTSRTNPDTFLMRPSRIERGEAAKKSRA